MSAYIDNLSERVWCLLRDGDDCFVSDKVLGQVGAKAIAEQISCHCAYRYKEGRYEFSMGELTSESKLDLVLVDSYWRSA